MLKLSNYICFTAKPILSGAENVQIRVSFKLQLNYTVLSYPQALSYEWLFNGQPLSLAGPLKTPGGGVLIIEEVSRADEGLYILRVTNEIGTGEWSTRVSVLCKKMSIMYSCSVNILYL